MFAKTGHRIYRDEGIAEPRLTGRFAQTLLGERLPVILAGAVAPVM